MYILLLAIVLGAGIGLAALGRHQRRRAMVLTGVGLFLGGASFFALLPFWGELYWFQALGYGERFWTAVWVQTASVLSGGLAGLARRCCGYAENFDKALEGLFEGIPERQTGMVVEGSFQELAQQANEAFKTYPRLQSERRFEAAGQHLQTLSELLQRLTGTENGETAVLRMKE